MLNGLEGLVIAWSPVNTEDQKSVSRTVHSAVGAASSWSNAAHVHREALIAKRPTIAVFGADDSTGDAG